MICNSSTGFHFQTFPFLEFISLGFYPRLASLISSMFKFWRYWCQKFFVLHPSLVWNLGNHRIVSKMSCQCWNKLGHPCLATIRNSKVLLSELLRITDHSDPEYSHLYRWWTYKLFSYPLSQEDSHRHWSKDLL